MTAGRVYAVKDAACGSGLTPGGNVDGGPEPPDTASVLSIGEGNDDAPVTRRKVGSNDGGDGGVFDHRVLPHLEADDPGEGGKQTVTECGNTVGSMVDLGGGVWDWAFADEPRCDEETVHD